MLKNLKNLVFKWLEVLELLIGIMVCGAILVAILFLVTELGVFVQGENKLEGLNFFMGEAFTVVIGIEFVKMLCKHKPSTVVEILMFAIARQMIVNHSTSFENLICVLGIAILFFVRKFLFSSYDEVEKTVFTPNARVKSVNQVCHVHIPYKDDRTILKEVIMDKITAEEKQITKGTSVFFEGVALRIAKVRGGEIKEIEVIRCINADVAHIRLS